MCAVGSWFLLPVVLAVVALVLAARAERTVAATGGVPGLVTAARWVAWINLLVAAMVIAFVSAFVVALWLDL